jgi:hypothetical protein
MRRRWRTRRVLKWAGTAVCAVIFLSAVVCLRWYTIGIGFAGHFSVSIHGGAICFNWKDPQRSREPPRSHIHHGFFVHAASDWASIRTAWYSGVLPRVGTTGLWYSAAVPLWIWLLVIGAPTVYLWRSNLESPGHCQRCGYDLTGNVSGTCPECGQPVQTVPKQRNTSGQ